MEYRNLGKSGLKVSRLCLGCMSYGVPERGPHPWTLDERQGRPFIARRSNWASTSSIPRTPIPTAPAKRSWAGAGRVRPPRRGGHRHQGLSPDAHRSQRPRPVAQNDHDRDRCQPPPAGNRLRRSLSNSPLGLHHPDRRNALGPRRRGPFGQGPLPGRLVDVCLAILSGARIWPTSMAGADSSRCRTITTCSIARKSARCSASAATSESASSLGVRWRGAGWPAPGKPSPAPRGPRPTK